MKSKNIIYLILILSIQILIACSESAQSENLDTPLVVKNTEVVVIQTPIPTLTITPSPLPISTLTSQEKIDWVMELQKDNGDCDFPCWWGIIPGVTTWQVADRILSPIASKKLVFAIENGMKMYYLEFQEISRTATVNIFVQSEGIVDVIRFGGDYSMISFLQNFSNPKEIWISSDGIVPGPSDFRITFFYPEKGIMAAFLGYSDLISQGGAEYIKMCVPDFNNSGPLWLWNPNSKKQFNELPLENLTGNPPTSLKLKRIGEYTNFDETDFLNSIAENSENTCLMTPANIWPNPDFYITPTP